MRNEKHTFRWAVFLRFLNMALSVLEPLLSAWIIVAYTESEIRKIILLALLILGQGVLSSLINYAASRMLRATYASMLKRMQIDLAERILRIRTDRMDKAGSGVFSRRLLNDTADIVDGIDELLGTFTEAFRLISLLIGFAIVSVPMFLFELALFVVYMLIQRAHSKSLQQNGREASVANERHSGFVSEMARAHRDIKLLHCEDSFMDKFTGSVRESVDLASRMRRRSMHFILLRSQFVSWTSCAYMFLLAFLMANHSMAPSTALVLFNYNGRVYTCASDLANLMSTAYSLGVSVERIYQLMNSPDYAWEQFGTRHLDHVRGELELRDVSFSYRDVDAPEECEVLRHIDLTIRKGEVVAVVGPSGSGKSTLVDLLPRFYDVHFGQILLDGQPLDRYVISDLRALFGSVNQDVILFNDTVYENIVFGMPDVTEEQVVAAAKIAQAHPFIMEMEEGYQTVIGDRGMRLSGGQRQRLSIARAILRHPEVLILDEATSALDNESEYLFQEALMPYAREHTAIIVAHRLSTIRFADTIVFVRDGQIVERGTHEELMALKGEYHRFCTVQQ